MWLGHTQRHIAREIASVVVLAGTWDMAVGVLSPCKCGLGLRSAGCGIDWAGRQAECHVGCGSGSMWPDAASCSSGTTSNPHRRMLCEDVSVPAR